MTVSENEKWNRAFERKIRHIKNSLESFGNLSNGDYEYEEKWIEEFYLIQKSNIDSILGSFKSKNSCEVSISNILLEPSSDYSHEKSKFVFVYNIKSSNIIKELDSLILLSDTSNYKYNNPDVEYYINYIYDLLDYEYSKFKKNKLDKPIFKSLLSEV